jgi:DNA-binding NarL/FixJ family response regulator
MFNSEVTVKKTLMIVDDSAVVRDRLRRMLHPIENLSVIGEVADGTEAQRQLLAIRPNIVILDLLMPGRNGLDILRQTRETLDDTIIAILTNVTDPHILRECERAGADYVFDKSSGIDQLLTMLKQL